MHVISAVMLACSSIQGWPMAVRQWRANTNGKLHDIDFRAVPLSQHISE